MKTGSTRRLALASSNISHVGNATLLLSSPWYKLPISVFDSCREIRGTCRYELHYLACVMNVRDRVP